MVEPRGAVAVAVMLTITAGAAHAQPVLPSPATPEPVDDVELRLAWLERVLDREAFATRVWRGGWIGFYSGAVALEALLAATATSTGPRLASGVSGGQALVGVVFTLVDPATAGPRADAVRALPRATRAERLARLGAAEGALRAIADEERARRGWFGLIGGALVTSAGASITWAGHRGNGGLGWLGVASSMVIAQAQFETQPTGAIRAWDAYRRAGAGAALGATPSVLRWSIRPTARGAALLGEF
jgi:hypothetical protein